MKKDYRSPNYLLTVQNDGFGWWVINQLKKNHKLHLRGRHPDRKYMMWLHGLTPNWTNDIPVRLSKTIAIYLRK